MYLEWANGNEGSAAHLGLAQHTQATSEPAQVASQATGRALGQAAELDQLESMGTGQPRCSATLLEQVSLRTLARLLALLALSLS